jgi:hypothetical protein
MTGFQGQQTALEKVAQSVVSMVTILVRILDSAGTITYASDSVQHETSCKRRAAGWRE